MNPKAQNTKNIKYLKQNKITECSENPTEDCLALHECFWKLCNSGVIPVIYSALISI